MDGNGHVNKRPEPLISRPESTWKHTGSIELDAMRDARLQAHIAAHLTAGPAKVFSVAQPDHAHLSLHWHPEFGEFSTGIMHGPVGMMSLQLSSMTISVTAIGRDDAELVLHGQTLAEAQAAIAQEISKSPHDGEIPSIPAPKAWPEHAVAHGAKFDCSDAAAFEELARHFNNAEVVLKPFADLRPDAAPVRTWPHHFDMATLISLDFGVDPETARSINVGFSPGDDQYPEPYWYVVPYPDPKRAAMPGLPRNGAWHLVGWTGAILKASSYGHLDSPSEQQAEVAGFLDTAYDVCLAVLKEDFPR